MPAKAPTPPTKLSHYTTLKGLQGIVESGSLWASNASFLNDRAELIHALDASERAIGLLSSRKALKAWAPMLREAFDELRDGRKADTFVACFCGDDDNLSQWRGYGGNVQGVSVTFNREALAKRLEKDHAKLRKVIYARISTASRLRNELAGELAALAELEEASPDRNDALRYNELLSRVSGLLPQFKHWGFRDEREWRFVLQKKVLKEELSFRISENKMVPYIVVGSTGEPLPIKSVRVGPGSDQELTAKSIKAFLNAHGYDVKVRTSDVPFRP
ncbi:DUF2971 domain-containing protein [Rhizobium leguminosarum]|uniref:DUF2971 domain-containing protein n=1 Tax=Rhizobium TaxID=379 RepID=UPI00102F4CAD|nr:DUF2971 domain-containing protein [Rhizobium leguminosarum]NKK10916.1 DUF2971 domain-containing protein [Rhizobium leguminosarum bv. viciae]TBF52845.1 DUF2971 domain-containing protein [Rhizobium leguminosarum]TBF73939.1 DUF2971 domain-containing protein [Rhizobium leguminosarum]TBG16974.1 DUF2971 domain-containing protein [Rhizobium leguminosarum]TBG21674.1 DUF2971 domain-containing protein [Rhizobium leguminosarum]